MKPFGVLSLMCLSVVCTLAVANLITEPFCYWSGTSPVCHGACETGEFVAATNKVGDGKTCVSGVKRYCCKMPPQWLAQLPPYFGLPEQVDDHHQHVVPPY